MVNAMFGTAGKFSPLEQELTTTPWSSYGNKSHIGLKDMWWTDEEEGRNRREESKKKLIPVIFLMKKQLENNNSYMLRKFLSCSSFEYWGKQGSMIQQEG